MIPAPSVTEYDRTHESDQEACSYLLSRLSIVRTAADEAQLLKAVYQPSKPMVLSFLNQHGLNLAWSDRSFRDALLRSDMVLRDGVGIAVCLKLLGRDPGQNMNGTDLIPRITDLYAGRTVMLIGTVSPYLERAANVLSVRGCRIIGTLNGFLPEDAYLDAIRRAQPDLIVLGMGMPRQEQISVMLAKALSKPVLIINGGAIIDFLGDRVQRAPAWIRAMRMEWAYRLFREPRRMFRRYVIGGFSFLRKIVRLRRLHRAGNGNSNLYR